MLSRGLGGRGDGVKGEGCRGWGGVGEWGERCSSGPVVGLEGRERQGHQDMRERERERDARMGEGTSFCSKETRAELACTI